ncbi:MAG TPA: hypothetical protein VE890_16260 [Thermoguttaceae bacterium]|nr:hypothetical protein [Thermoguttaceae bacterium]
MNNETTPPPDRGRFVWWQAAFWLPACVAMGMAAAWVAHVVQTHFAPFAVFPLLVGAGLGATTAGLMRLTQVGHRPSLLLGILLGASVAVAGQHGLDYRRARDRARWEVELVRRAKQQFPDGAIGSAPRPPEDIVDYLRHQAAVGRSIGSYSATGWQAWSSWAIDGLLLLGAATAIVARAVRQPYCNRCRSWYRPVRTDRIDSETAREMIQVAGLTACERPAEALCRLCSCDGGCGPTGFQMKFKESDKWQLTARVWLDAKRRDRMTQLLDSAMRQEVSAQDRISRNPDG